VKRWVTLLLAAVILAGLGSGCGGDRDKDINRDKDRPKAAPEK
jgi:hypothetical protein